MRRGRDPQAPGDASKLEWFCFTCTFRPWIDAGDAEVAEVKVIDESTGDVERVPAIRQGGRWVTTRMLAGGELAVVERGAVEDPHGNFNGNASGILSGGPGPPPPPPPPGGCGTLLAGTGGIDALRGTRGADLIIGLAGADVLAGRRGVDCLFGGRGRDRLKGGRGGDSITGGYGDDRVKAGRGADRIQTAAQGDFVDCGPGRDFARVGNKDPVRHCERVVRGPL